MAPDGSQHLSLGIKAVHRRWCRQGCEARREQSPPFQPGEGVQKPTAGKKKKNSTPFLQLNVSSIFK